MKPFVAPDLIPAFPEIFLAVMALLLLVLGVSRKEEDFRNISTLCIIALIATGTMVWRAFDRGNISTFDGMYLTDSFSAFMKTIIIAGSALSIFMAGSYAARERVARFEYPVLVVLSTVGMMLMVSAGNLMSLYLAIELQSLPLYVLAAMQRDSLRSTEAGLKYFVLGALSSGMLLYGASLIYGHTGTADFGEIRRIFLAAGGFVEPAVVVGLVLMISGLAFKLAAVPFHMWSPDVYEGAPTPVTMFFAVAPKVAALALFTRVLQGPFSDLSIQWQQVVVALSIFSMALGAVAGVAQRNIKRLLAYSSIGHVGYLLIGLAAAGTQGVQSMLVYILIYVIATVGTFAVVLMMKQKDRMVESIDDLAGLGQRQPLVALAMTIMMFSMAGIPPLAGFFGKLFIFQAAIVSELYMLAVIGVLASVVAAFYYLRIIKIMYFDQPAEEHLDKADDPRLNLALGVSAVLVVVFIALMNPVVKTAEAAAASLVKEYVAAGS